MRRTLVKAVFEHSEAQPNKIAIICKNTSLTYRELAFAVENFAAILKHQYEIRSGDKIMISAVSKPDFIVALLAVQYLGAIAVHTDKTTKETNLAALYDFIEPKFIITDAKYADQKIKTVSLKDIYAKSVSQDGVENFFEYEMPEPDMIAEILFTTGTTGIPKGGMLSYESIEAISENHLMGIGIQSDDVVLNPLPLNHSLGIRGLRSILYCGATLVLQNGFVFINDLEKNIENFKCTSMMSVPATLETVLRQLGEEKFVSVMKSLRYIDVGAGSLSAGFRTTLAKLLPNTKIFNTYGSTETGGTIFWSSDRMDKVNSLGKLIPGIDYKTIDNEGNEIKSNSIETAGRLALRGKMQMSGYFKNHEATKVALSNGWLVTNDLCYFDEDGYVYMVGRADDIINVGGEKVSPVEIENVASTFEGIRECACIGVDDTVGTYGKIPVLFVVPENIDFDEKAMKNFLSQRLERYKLPHEYIIVESLPRNRMKKIDRKTLQTWYNTRSSSETLLSNEVIMAIHTRRSIREFTDVPIAHELLETIVKCGIYAPSGHNMQSWHFTVITHQNKIDELKQTIESAAKKNNVYFYGYVNPKAVILVSEDRRSPFAFQNASVASENIMLAAHSFGIGSVWVNALSSVCDDPEIRPLLTSLGVPEKHIVVSTICLGYPMNYGKELAKKQNVITWN